MCLFRKRFNPALLDLVKYEKDLLYQREHKIALRPPPSIPSLLTGNWSDAEMQAMRDNRNEAQSIYRRIGGK